MAVIAYLLLCVIAGVLGRNSRVGFWGVTAASILFTPVLTLLLVVLFGHPDERR